MKIIIDTHAFLWFVEGSSRLSVKVKDLIENSENEIYLSMASIWEMSIKLSLGKLKIAEDFGKFIYEQLEANEINVLEINISHALKVKSIPFHHRDPFDRMIISQSIVENFPVASVDSNFSKYEIDLIW